MCCIHPRDILAFEAGEHPAHYLEILPSLLLHDLTQRHEGTDAVNQAVRPVLRLDNLEGIYKPCIE